MINTVTDGMYEIEKYDIMCYCGQVQALTECVVVDKYRHLQNVLLWSSTGTYRMCYCGQVQALTECVIVDKYRHLQNVLV
jgi:hypothetical protein